MPIDANEVVAYGCANHAEDDSSLQGGAIDLTVKVQMTPMAVADDIEMLSSAAGDTTPTVRVTARDAGGSIVQDTQTVNDTTPVAFFSAANQNRVLKVEVLSGTLTGTLTVRRGSAGPTICTLEPGITEVRTLFYDAASGASPKSLYEKFFIKNLDPTLAVTNATVKLTVEPASVGDFLMALEDAVDDTGTSTNRVTAPSGVGTFRQLDVAEPLPGGVDLAAGEAIGVWLRCDLAADNVAILDDWQVQLSGSAI